MATKKRTVTFVGEPNRLEGFTPEGNLVTYDLGEQGATFNSDDQEPLGMMRGPFAAHGVKEAKS